MQASADVDIRLELSGLDALSLAALEAQPADAAPIIAAFAAANRQLDAGALDKATDTAVGILVGNPVTVVTATNCVLMFRETGRPDLADSVAGQLTDCLQRRLEERPDDLQGRMNFARVLIALDQPAAADAALFDALRLDPLNEALIRQLEARRLHAGDPDGAIAAWAGPFAAAPANGRIRLNLARKLAHHGFSDLAKRLLDQAETLTPDKSHEFRYIADGIRGTASDKDQAAMAVEVFDRFSATYDTVLKGIGNQGPEMVRKVLAQLSLPRGRKLSVLDAGCGTGLCAPLLRPLAKRLWGCDLSAGMLAQARKKRAYDQLSRADLASLFTLPAGPFDLIVSSDVLVYFGDLAQVFDNFARILRPGGWLIVTCEDALDRAGALGWVLDASGRHKHGLAYLTTALTGAGFAPPRIALKHYVRREFGKPVPGLALAVQRLSLSNL